ncbi:frp, partial [Acrasis kona]
YCFFYAILTCLGKELKELSAVLCNKFDKGEVEQPEYQNRPKQVSDDFARRLGKYGEAIFKVKNIDRSDVEARKLHDRENYTFYNAPLFLIVHAPADAVAGTFLDMGLFIQNIILGFESYGIGSCPQFSITKFNQTIRNYLGEIIQNRLIVCGISIGYADMNKPVNLFFPEPDHPETYIYYHKK